MDKSQYPFRPEVMAKQPLVLKHRLPPDLADMKNVLIEDKPPRGSDFSQKVADIVTFIAIVGIVAAFAIIYCAKHDPAKKGGDKHVTANTVSSRSK
jgi:hypothetical protein